MSLCACVSALVYLCMCLFTVSVCACVSMFARYVFVNVCVHVYVFVYVYLCVFLCVHVCASACVWTCMCVYSKCRYQQGLICSE